MNASEIISADSQRNGVDPRKALLAVAMLVNKKATVMQSGNSVLICTPIAPACVEVHLATVDQPLALMRAMADFYQKLKNSPIRKVYGKADNPQIIEFMKRLGGQVTESDKPGYNWMGVL
jgi:hypothetical protein